tara:strand:- start:4734 stop:4928 length:195 start_codon:yes stop_codon:yes gene_type:complete
MITTDVSKAKKLSIALLDAQEAAENTGRNQHILHMECFDDFIVLDSELGPEKGSWPTAIIVEPN